MNDRQRILTLLSGGTPDRVPWFGDLDYWAEAMVGRGQVPADFKRSDAYFQLNRDLRVGFYLQGYFPFQARYDATVEEAAWSEGDDRLRRLRTPVGELTERWTYLPGSFATAPRERLVKTPADLRTLRYVYDHTVFESDYAEAARRVALVRDIGVVLCYAPRTPFMQLVALDAGIEAVTNLAMDAPGEFAETLRAMEDRLEQAVDLAIASPAECIMIPENLSSEVVGKFFFETYMRRCQEKWVARIAAAGKYSFIHIDGTLRGLLGEEGSVGFSVLEALTPAPVGDVPIDKMRDLAGPKSILWGGLPGIYFTPLVKDAEFDRLAREVLDVMRRQGRCVLGVADQVPPDALRDRVARVADLADRYGRYA